MGPNFDYEQTLAEKGEWLGGAKHIAGRVFLSSSYEEIQKQAKTGLNFNCMRDRAENDFRSGWDNLFAHFRHDDHGATVIDKFFTQSNTFDQFQNGRAQVLQKIYEKHNKE